MASLQALLAGPRRPSYTFTLLDQQDRPLRDLDTVKAWSLELNANTRLGASGSLELLHDRGVDFQKHRLKVSYNPGVEGVDGWDLGVFLFAEPSLDHEATHSTISVKLISKLAVVDEDSTVQSYSVAKGQNLVAEAAILLRSVGETRLSVQDNDLTARESIQFGAGESILTVVNELLDAAGYWSLSTDGGGSYRLEPYVLPSARPIVWDFQAGELAVHAPQWSRDQDISSVPNRVICRTSGEDETPALVGVAENTNAASPFSYQARGRWVTRVYDVEAAGQAEINQLAQRRLIQAGYPVGTISIQHAPVPVFPREAVRFTSGGVSTVATVAKMSISSPGHWVSTELKEVNE